jgi:hypothetical protein
MATKRALVIAMPISAYGYWGPLLSQEGLCRLAKEIALFVGDNTKNVRPAQAKPLAGNQQGANRIAVSAYSAGALDALHLFESPTLAELTSKMSRGNETEKEFAQRIKALKAGLWSAPAAEIVRNWKEYYNIDGFYGSDEKFPDQLAAWFGAAPDRMLRVYATPGRMKDAKKVVDSQLSTVLKDREEEEVHRGGNSFKGLAWHRRDGRASLAWFSTDYMRFKSVRFMPQYDEKEDLAAHHTIPRVVLSHAVSQSGFLQM